jgi:hypothetical protein
MENRQNQATDAAAIIDDFRSKNELLRDNQMAGGFEL